MSKSNETTPNVPTLRFREFTDSWTLIPIKKLLRFQNGINADSTKYGKGIKPDNRPLTENFITKFFQ